MILRPEEFALLTVLAAAKNREVQMDDLAWQAQLPIHTVASLLLGLEFRGVAAGAAGQEIRAYLRVMLGQRGFWFGAGAGCRLFAGCPLVVRTTRERRATAGPGPKPRWLPHYPVVMLLSDNELLIEQAFSLPPLNRGLAFGDGFFETLIFTEGRLRLAADHCIRMQQRCRRPAPGPHPLPWPPAKRWPPPWPG
ncbi:MAG: hypothetical protein WKG07_30080 [Hymenobacter sp.]